MILFPVANMQQMAADAELRLVDYASHPKPAPNTLNPKP